MAPRLATQQGKGLSSKSTTSWDAYSPKCRRARGEVPLDAWGRAEDDQAAIVIASWVYVGSGYETEGERWLALSAAARAREQREVAREELRTMRA
jgi:hypothetical protein